MIKASKVLISVIILSAALILCGSPIFGQINSDNAPASESNTGVAEKTVPEVSDVKDSAEKSQVNIEKTDGNPAEKNISNKAESKTGIKDTRQVKKEEAAPTAAAKDADGLLTITEGNYKYKRIPDINIPEDSDFADEENHSKSQEVVISSGDTSGEGEAEDNTKGIFGVSKKTGETIIVVTLLIIIIGVIIVLKVKSKGKDENVLRRFPRA